MAVASLCHTLLRLKALSSSRVFKNTFLEIQDAYFLWKESTKNQATPFTNLNLLHRATSLSSLSYNLAPLKFDTKVEGLKKFGVFGTGENESLQFKLQNPSNFLEVPHSFVPHPPPAPTRWSKPGRLAITKKFWQNLTWKQKFRTF